MDLGRECDRLVTFTPFSVRNADELFSCVGSDPLNTAERVHWVSCHTFTDIISSSPLCLIVYLYALPAVSTRDKFSPLCMSKVAPVRLPSSRRNTCIVAVSEVSFMNLSGWGGSNVLPELFHIATVGGSSSIHYRGSDLGRDIPLKDMLTRNS